jgi:4-hydroxy-L-threonine phosphate dehydrogenase PdxA
MKKKILILSGDPNSINSELIYKSWKKINNSLRKKIYLISNFNLLKKQFKKLNYPIKIIKLENEKENIISNKLKVINIDIKFKKPFGVLKKDASKFVIDCLNKGHQLALKKNVTGLINCAIDKKLLKQKNIGVTEYLASKCNVKNNSEVMLIRNKKLSVVPITTHIDIKQVSKKIKSKIIANKVKIIEKWFKGKFNKKPKFGILGLNPHNAELRMDSEEYKIIVPTVLKLKKLGINIKGPLIADTLFINDYKKFDIIIGMFHDQVLTPFKAIFKFSAVNITLGLKYLRVSPDHGTAVNLIGKNKASIDSLLECISFVNKFGK